MKLPQGELESLSFLAPSSDEKLNVAENVKSFWYFPKNKQKYHVRTMASTIATLTSSSKQCFNHNLLPRTVHKRFWDFVSKKAGELQVLKIVTHEQILLAIPSPQNDVTLTKIPIFINPIYIFRIPRTIFFKINIVFLILNVDLVQSWNRIVFNKNQ